MSAEQRSTRVACTFRFEAAHHLPLHPGKCHELHGHGYRLDVIVEGPVGANGMVMDFAAIEELVQSELLSRWDHRLLNNLIDNPTAELLAGVAFDTLIAAGLPLSAIRLWETDDCWAEVAR